LDTPVTFTDPGADVETVTVDFGDKTGVQTVARGSGFRSVNLRHVYTADASFLVVVTVTDEFGGSDRTTFLANVFLPGISDIGVAMGPRGATGATATATGVVAPLFKATRVPRDLAKLSYLIVASVPPVSMQALPAAPFQITQFAKTTSFDVRAVNVDPGDSVVIQFTYKDGGIPNADPVLEFFNPASGRFEGVVARDVVVAKGGHTITVTLDNGTFPTVANLTGEVFTIVVPAQPPQSTQTATLSPALALALPGQSSGDFSTSFRARASSELTVSVTT